MKKLILIISFFLLPFTSQASPQYIDNGLVIEALEAAFGIGSGVGVKSESCLLCHAITSGGTGTLNAGFGTDFRDAAIRLGATSGAGLPATGGFLSLEDIFSDPDFGALDSDGDGISNREEFIANTDPAESGSGSSGGESTTGGSCGTIFSGGPGGSGLPPSVGLLLLLPLALIWALRRRRLLLG